MYAMEYQKKKKSENEEAFRSRHTETVRAWRAKKNTDPAYRDLILEKSRASYDKRRGDDAFREKRSEQANTYFHKNKTNPEFALKRCKMGAKHRSLDWTLKDEDAVDMMSSPCAYCGNLPEDGINGIDRMDSSLGYTPDNCVPCCKTCNFLKACLDPLTFIERCQHIAGIEDHSDAWVDKKASPYSRYHYKSRVKNMEFDITEAEFQTLTSQACTYCSKRNTPTHTNGIDRVDSALGYTVDNCVPCCGECNVMKKTLSDIEFRDACAAVARHSPNNPLATMAISRRKYCITHV